MLTIRIAASDHHDDDDAMGIMCAVLLGGRSARRSRSSDSDGYHLNYGRNIIVIAMRLAESQRESLSHLRRGKK